MQRKGWLILSFVVGTCITTIGAWLKITHEEGADSFLVVGLIVSLAFVVMALYEILGSDRINRSEKALWVIGFLCAGTIAGLIYLLIGRRGIVAPS